MRALPRGSNRWWSCRLIDVVVCRVAKRLWCTCVDSMFVWYEPNDRFDDFVHLMGTGTLHHCMLRGEGAVLLLLVHGDRLMCPFDSACRLSANICRMTMILDVHIDLGTIVTYISNQSFRSILCCRWK